MGDLCLLGKTISVKPMNIEAMMTNMKKVWNLPHGMTYTALDDSIALFYFSNPVDKKRVMEGRPWSFDKTYYNGSIPLTKVSFTHCPFWIQVFNLPLELMNKAIAEFIDRLSSSLPLSHEYQFGSWLHVENSAPGTTTPSLLATCSSTAKRHVPNRSNPYMDKNKSHPNSNTLAPGISNFIIDKVYPCTNTNTSFPENLNSIGVEDPSCPNLLYSSAGWTGYVMEKRLDVVIIGSSSRYINAIVYGLLRWRLTGIYGEPATSRRKDAWDVFENLRHKSTLRGYALVTLMKF
ncbi:hypothetical protein ACH5RR_017829 [Cinchona calisaya]|uniref:DUF4283 domain-containing protein n=1 Tax=Cinchona calisaya TaxID=153742 RepID=A0ABD2ZJP6_9GENT